MKKFLLLVSFGVCSIFPLSQILSQTCTHPDNCVPNSNCQCPPLSCKTLEEETICSGCILLKSCNSAGSYNCHQYTRANLNSVLPNGLYKPEYNVPCTFARSQIATDVAFIPVCNISHAQAIFYSNNHSGVFDLQTSDPNDIISKWGEDGPLWEHSKDQYESVQTFYAYIGGISLPSVITTPVQPTVKQRSGISYSWSAVPNGIVSISNANTATPTITPICTGNVQIFLTATGGCSNHLGGDTVRTQCISTTSAPTECMCNAYVTGSYVSNSSTFTLSTFNNTYSYGTGVTVSCGTANSFSWTKTSGSGTFITTTFNGSGISVYLNTGQSISLNVVATDANGCTIGSKSVVFTRDKGGWGITPPESQISILENMVNERSDDKKLSESNILTLSPNPNNGEMFIFSNKEEVLYVTVYDYLGRMVRSNTLKTEDFNTKLDIVDQNNGLYLVNIRTSNNAMQTFKVIVFK